LSTEILKLIGSGPLFSKMNKTAVQPSEGSKPAFLDLISVDNVDKSVHKSFLGKSGTGISVENFGGKNTAGRRPYR
jgi:hypothetical protein